MSENEYIGTGFPELDILEDYLIRNGIPHDRIDFYGELYFNRHQIIVYEDNEKKKRSWDVICQFGSYGYEEGLLEVMGVPVVRDSDGDDVCGYLTAENVIERFEEYMNKKRNASA